MVWPGEKDCNRVLSIKFRGYRKCMLSVWLNKGIFCVSEPRLVDQANTIHRNSWMTEKEIQVLTYEKK